MDIYYEKASKQLENNEVEEAITTLLAGLDHGYAKCAYALLHTVMNDCTYTMTEEEAASIFASFYPSIRLLALQGDTEAMVMVAQGIRYAFVEDDEPYLYWLTRAATLGDKQAAAILEEIDPSEDPWALPDVTVGICDATHGGMDETDRLLADEVPEPEVDVVLPEEHVLLADPDWVMREQFGINDYFNTRKREYELKKCRDDQALEELAQPRNPFEVGEMGEEAPEAALCTEDALEESDEQEDEAWEDDGLAVTEEEEDFDDYGNGGVL